MLILMAEDQADLAELTIDYLQDEAIECDYACDGNMAMNLLSVNQYDVVVLDVNMPKTDGFAVCRWLRAKQDDTPVLFLTARDTLDDKLLGFDCGAQDYLCKPFEPQELLARVKVLGNGRQARAKRFSLDNLKIEISEHRLYRGEKEIQLPPTQWQLLVLLAQHSPNLVSKAQIAEALWPAQEVNDDRLKMLIFRLRNAIDTPGNRPLVHTIRGAGVALRNP